jgi:hypothetical protein
LHPKETKKNKMSFDKLPEVLALALPAAHHNRKLLV